MRPRKRPAHPTLFDQWDRIEVQVEATSKTRIEQRAAAVEHEKLAGRWKRPSKASNFNRIRLAEIQKLIRHRCGGPCDTDDGDNFLQAALPFLVRLYPYADGLEKIIGWAQVWLPKVHEDYAAEQTDCALRSEAPIPSPDALARMLGLMRDERTALRIRTIGAVDFTSRQRKTERKKKDRAYQAEKRRKAGATPRSESNVAKAKAAGVSLSTYNRQLKRAADMQLAAAPDTISSAIVRSTHDPLRDQVRLRDPAVADPARSARPRPIVGTDGHAPSGKTRAVPAGHAVALPLPVEGVSQHPDMLGEPEPQRLGDVLMTYLGGVMSPELARIVRDAQRVRMMTQEAVARQIGVSRPQLANALQGRFGLSRSAAANLREWLAAA